MRAPENPQEFVQRWGGTAQNLAQADAMRLLISFSRMLPGKGVDPSAEKANLLGRNADQFLRARLQGTKLGVFDVLFDTLAAEQVEAGQAKTAESGIMYYDVWSVVFTHSSREQKRERRQHIGAEGIRVREKTGLRRGTIRSGRRCSLLSRFIRKPAWNSR